MKIANIFFVIMFLVFAALQYNDPDPFIWIPIYLYAALLCYLAIHKRFFRMMYIVGIAVYLAYTVYLFFNESGVLSWINQHDEENIVQTMKATKPWIEQTREFFGLIILLVALTINMLWLSKSSNRVIIDKGLQ